MKKLLVVAVAAALCLMLVGSAFAAGTMGKAHKNTGCGLGTMLWENHADNSVLSQTMQATTNASTYTQLFGITSGTSECDQPANIAKNDRLNEFVVANMDNLAKDIAMGRGETLDTFAELLRIPAQERTAFYQKLQSNFARIFTSENVVLANVVDNIAAVSSN